MATTTIWAITITGEGLTDASIKDATARCADGLLAAGAVIGRARYETSQGDDLLTAERERAAKHVQAMIANAAAEAAETERRAARATAEIAAVAAAQAKDAAVAEVHTFMAGQLADVEKAAKDEADEFRAKLVALEAALAEATAAEPDAG